MRFKMRFGLFILSFMILYLAGGRKIAVPYGVALTSNPWLIVSLTLAADLLQIPFFYFVYGTGKKIFFLRQFKIDRKSGKARIKKYTIWNFVQRLGNGGIFILASLPSFGGGIWSSVLLAFLLKTDKKVVFFLIAVGSFIGITLLAFLSHGIIQSIINLIH